MGNKPSATPEGEPYYHAMREPYSKVWQRTTKANDDIYSNPEHRTRYLPPLPGEQSGWRRVGVAAKYNPQQNMLKSGYRFVLEEQQYNNGFRYRIQDNEQIAPIRLGWHQTKVHNDQVLKAHNFPEGKSTRDQRMPEFYQIRLDMKSNFGADYRPENIFGDAPMTDSKYRSSNVSQPVRKQV